MVGHTRAERRPPVAAGLPRHDGPGAIAAGVAGGCTASLAVSGGAAAAPGAFLFMIGMFGGGIPMARFLYRGSKMNGVLSPLLVGFAFGWVLQKGKLGRYETIVNVFRFTDLTVVKFLVSALMVGMFGIQALVSLGLARRGHPQSRRPTSSATSWAASSSGRAWRSRGSVRARWPRGRGKGRLDNAIAGSLGLYTGAVVFGVAYPRLYPRRDGREPRVGHSRARDPGRSLARRHPLLGDGSPRRLCDRARTVRRGATSGFVSVTKAAEHGRCKGRGRDGQPRRPPRSN